jgi:metal-responsive CopG/Arc/MetJ family transcriptional regulator
MQKNITMAMDEKLLKKARKIAFEKNKSLSDLIRKYLQQLVEKEEMRKNNIVNELEKLFNNSHAEIGNKKCTRDQLYER